MKKGSSRYRHYRTTALCSPVILILLLAASCLWASDPDAFEDDDTYLTAHVVDTGSSAAPALHTFHDEGDEDWVKFFGYIDDDKDDHEYIVYISDVGSRCSIVIEVYTDDGKTLLTDPFDDAVAGEETTVTFTITREGIYYIRLRNSDPAVYGDDTDYRLMVQPGTSSGKPIGTGTITGTFTDAQSEAPLNNGLIRTDIGTAALPDRGVYQMVHSAGNFILSATANGYLSFSTQVTVEAGETSTINIAMEPLPADPVDPGDPEKPSSCFIEEIYGPQSPEAAFFRHYRDTVLAATPTGRTVIKLYYTLDRQLTDACTQHFEIFPKR